jgi:UDP-N-acetylglucosamine 2-epimerase (non-hydrolysing)
MESIPLNALETVGPYLSRQRQAGKKLIAFAIGTRPEAIKIAPVIRAFQRRPDRFVTATLVTGQHPDVVAMLRDDFGVEESGNLHVMQPRQSLNRLTGRIFLSFDDLWAIVRAYDVAADLWIVQGDTTSAIAVAMAGVYNRRQVAHLEAGLRSGNRWDPFPEEINRRLLTQLATLHFAPTPAARRALRKEGIESDTVAVVGNTGVDALLYMLAKPFVSAGTPLEGVPLDDGRLIVATMHRRESWPQLDAIAQGLLGIVSRFDDVRIVVPVHPNPEVGVKLHASLKHPRIHLVPALPYAVFVHLMQKATIILTDSGGIQEEAPSLRRPALVLRDSTERAEAIGPGQIKIIGRRPERIVEETSRLLKDPVAYKMMQQGDNPFGDGLASERIVEAVERWFADAHPLLPRSREFHPNGVAHLRVA